MSFSVLGKEFSSSLIYIRCFGPSQEVYTIPLAPLRTKGLPSWREPAYIYAVGWISFIVGLCRWILEVGDPLRFVIPLEL